MLHDCFRNDDRYPCFCTCSSSHEPGILGCLNGLKIGVAVSADSVFQQVSYVNAICTIKGGTHVECVANQVISKLLPVLKRKNKAEVSMNCEQASRFHERMLLPACSCFDIAAVVVKLLCLDFHKGQRSVKSDNTPYRGRS